MTIEKVALIMAGGSGMGAAAARKLAQDGYKVAILSSSGRGEALAKELGGVGVTGSNLVDADVQRLVDLAMETWGRIDALVNSAGHGPRAPILGITDEDWHQGMEVYFLSAVRPIRLVTPIDHGGTKRRRYCQHFYNLGHRADSNLPNLDSVSSQSGCVY